MNLKTVNSIEKQLVNINTNKQELNTNQFNLTIQFCNKRNKFFMFLDLKTSNEKRNSYFTNCNEDKKELIKKVIELI